MSFQVTKSEKRGFDLFAITLMAMLVVAFALYTSMRVRVQQQVLNESIRRIVALEAVLRIQCGNTLGQQQFDEGGVVASGAADRDRRVKEPKNASAFEFEKNCFDEYGLTDREEEILHYLLLGKDAREIGERLVLSNSTVKSHTYNIYRKLGIHSRKEAVLLFEEQGLMCQLGRV